MCALSKVLFHMETPGLIIKSEGLERGCGDGDTQGIIIAGLIRPGQLQVLLDLIDHQAHRLDDPGFTGDFVKKKEAKELLAKEGFDPTFGARPLRRAIQRLVEDPLSDELLRGSFQSGDVIVVDARDGQIVFEKKREPALAE